MEIVIFFNLKYLYFIFFIVWWVFMCSVDFGGNRRKQQSPYKNNLFPHFSPK
jgi:hypothetical protein